MDFVHLHVHNEYSYLDGLGTAEAYIKRAKEIGFQYLGITNHGNIDGLIKFQKECDRQKLNPVLGCEAYIVKDFRVKEKGEKKSHVTLLIKNEVGYQNLCRMLTIANLEGFYYKPRIDFNLLYNNCEGLVVLSGCSNSFLNLDMNDGLAILLKNKLGKDFYLELMPHCFKGQEEINKYVLKLSKTYGISTVATNDCHYINIDDEESHQVLLAIQTKALWTDEDRFKFKVKGLYLRSRKEMFTAFSDQNILTAQQITESLDNTIDIAERCSSFRIKKQGIFLPIVSKYKDEDPYKYLHGITLEKLIHLKDIERKTYRERLREEWGLINSKGFASYFLIVYELIQWCKENDIMTGPGRGSVGGSLVAYLLGITCVDPIKYNLLFSRFISEDRIDFPDIDIDFEDSKREMIRKHLSDLYGDMHVASISTFLTMKAKMAIRDVSRVFSISTKDVDDFSKAIYYEDDTSIHQVCKETMNGIEFKKKYPRIIEHAIKLENQVRGIGTHAAAVIISADDLTHGTKGNLYNRSDLIVSNWDMEDSEYVGLMKLDVLGLNTLSVLNEAKKTIKNNYNKDIVFEEIPLNDKKVYREISSGSNIGVFQIGTWATDKLAKKIKADNIFLLSDLIALVRPGTSDSGMTEIFLDRKNGQRWEKKHSIYEEITKDTYGIIVYQEQVMEVIYKVAGLPYSVADKIRKIIGKKRDVKEFKQYEDMFIDGCIKNKIFNSEEAVDFWSMLQSHAKYSFNKSHSIEYAILAYWTAYLKYYYPIEFICANLNCGSDLKTKKEEFVEEAYKLKLEVQLPSAKYSDPIKWTVKDDILYVPFIEIKGIGDKLALDFLRKKPLATHQKKLDGFFKIEEKAKDKSKLEKILDEISSAINSREIQKYFSFKIKLNKG